MSGEKLTLPEALAAIMGDVQSISKDQRVTEGPARFNFRGVDDVMKAVGPALRKHGVIFAPSRVVSVEHERYLTSNNKPMDGVTVVVEYTITGPAGDTMTAAAAGQAADSGDKAVPKAMSVAFRTVLLQALCVPTDEPDPDTQVHERGHERAHRVPSRAWAADLAGCATVEDVQELWRGAVAAGDMTDDLAAAMTMRSDQLKNAADADPWSTPAPQAEELQLPEPAGAS